MKWKSLVLLVACSVVFFSCLKTSDQFGWEADNGSIVVEIYEASAYGPVGFLGLNSDPTSEQVDLLTIKFHAPRSLKPSNDIQVSLVEDPAAVTAFGLTPLPSNAFTLGSTTLTVPKETGTVTLPITFEKNNLDITQTYGIAFNISSVSEGTISELAKSIIIIIQIF